MIKPQSNIYVLFPKNRPQVEALEDATGPTVFHIDDKPMLVDVNAMLADDVFCGAAEWFSPKGVA